MIQGLCSLILFGILLVFGGPQPAQAAVGDSLMHNSANPEIGNTYGNWGIAGAKYGQFTCLTCHEPDAANIKRIKGTITVPDTSQGNIPGTGAVSFQNTTSFGNDADNHNQSRRVCELCHTQTKYHLYDASSQSNKTHGNRSDCATSSCHPHNKGFAGGGCDACHGNPPTTPDYTPNTGLVYEPYPTGATNPLSAGGHAKHTTLYNNDCNVCHTGTTMSQLSYTIQMGFNFYGANRGGRFSGYTSSKDYRFVSSNAGTTVSKGVGTAYTNTCSNLYCHGGGDSVNGKAALKAATAGANQSPSWVGGASQASCGTCHAVGTDYNTAGSHNAHANTLALTCSKCHGGITNNAHVDGKVYWNLTTAWSVIGANATYDPAGAVGPAKSGDTGALAPSASFGTCKNFYCHSDGRRVAAQRIYTTATWGGAPKPCDSCHGNGASFRTISTGAHVGHVKNASIGTNYRCYLCHAATAGYADTTVVGNHANGSIQVTYSGVNNRNKKTGYNPTFDSGSYFCSNVYCHSDGRAVLAQRAYTSIQWSKSVTIGCDGCHGKGTGYGFPNYSGTGEGQVGANSHPTHVGQSGYACSVCHVNTATGFDLKSGTTLHTNGPGQTTNDVYIDVAYESGGPVGYNASSKECANTACHNAFSPGWGGTTYCNTCHSNQGAGLQTVSLTGKHGKHADYATAGNYNFACENCHTRFSGMSSAKHLNQKINVRFRLGRPYGNWSTTAYGDDPAKSYKYRSMSRNPYTGATVYGHYTAGTSYTNDPVKGLQYSTNGRCTNVWCHSNSAPLGGLNNYSSVRWNATLGCKSCHADNTTSGGGKNLSVVHDKHVSPAGYAYTCDKCHAKTMAQGSTGALKSYTGVLYHVNARKDANFVQPNANTVYSAANNSCTNNYCHSQGRVTSGDFTSSVLKPYSTARWSGTLPTNCTGCHGGNASAAFKAITTGRHKAHVYNEGMLGTGNNYKCSTCHLNIVSNGTDTTLISGSLNRHVDTIKNYSGVNNGTEASVGKYRPTRNGCYNVNCHTTANPNLVNIGKPYYIPMTSAANSWKTAPVNQCKTCHGQTTGAFAGYTDLYGAPSYANNTTTGIKLKNNHRSHVRKLETVSYPYGSTTKLCVECHRRTVMGQIDKRLRNYSTYHLNRDGGNPVRVSFLKGGGYDSLSKTCNNTDAGCHGSTAMAWGGAGSCDACHLNVGAADANENYVYEGGGGPKTLIGGTEWTNTGHGHSGSNYLSGNLPANMDGGLRCYYCHDDTGTYGHGVATNFFRLKNFGYNSGGAGTWGPGGVNGVCMICHDGTYATTGVGGVVASAGARIKAAHYGAQHSNNGLRGGGRACWDCHDPHGDSNKYMIQTKVAKRSDPTNNSFIPISSVTVTFMPPDNTPPGSIAGSDLADYPVTGVSTKICNRCHVYNISGAKNYYTATYSNGHNSGTNCLASCHLHDGPSGAGKEDAFKGLGVSSGGSNCDSCHEDSSNAASLFSNNTSLYSMHSARARISYKHYMNVADYDYVFGASAIPDGQSTNKTSRRCTMCHVDHDKFNTVGKMAYNLRLNATVDPGVGDGYNNDYKLCLSCHTTEKTKFSATPDGQTKVLPIPYPLVGASAYNNATSVLTSSTHGYTVKSAKYKDGTQFDATCVKCHNDSMGGNGEAGTKSGVNGQYSTAGRLPRFGSHNSTIPSRFSVFSNDFYQGTATNGTSTTLNVSPAPASWTPNRWKGFSLNITRGVASNARFTIYSSTTTTLYLNPADSSRFAANPDSNTIFEISVAKPSVDDTCFSCHSKGANGEKPYASYSTSDWYGQRKMKKALVGMKDLFAGDTGTIPTVNNKSTVTVTLKKNTWTSTNIVGYKLKTPGATKTVTGLTAGPTAVSGGYSYTLTVDATFSTQAGKVTLLKPASHPLDTFGRHDSFERVTAGQGWNKGDTGTITTAGSQTQLTDSTKTWTSDNFNGMTITFPDKGYKTRTIGAGSVQGVLTFGNITGLTTADRYFIGLRHVACADCHNTHASTHNPEGIVTLGNTTSLNANDSVRIRGWQTNKWIGYLIRVRKESGVDKGLEQVRYVIGFDYNAGHYRVSLPWITGKEPAAGDVYEVLMGDKWTAAGQSGGRAGSGSAGTWGVVVKGFPAYSTNGFKRGNGQLVPTQNLTYKKIENVFDNISATGLGGSTIAGQRDLCVKCHGYYSYGLSATAPMTPSGNPNVTVARSTDSVAEFNPSNVAHHAVYARGNNQPIKKGIGQTYAASYYNTNWPRFQSTLAATNGAVAGSRIVNLSNDIPRTVLPGWILYIGSQSWPAAGSGINFYEVTQVLSKRQIAVDPPINAAQAGNGLNYFLTAGLGNTFVPPYGPWSILRCTDCHGSTKTDPVGPHASVNSWLLKDADIDLQFEWYGTGGVNNAATGVTTISYATVWPAGSTEKRYFCFNCHRTDVYGGMAATLSKAIPAQEIQSRLPHGSMMYAKDGGNVGLDSTDTSTNRTYFGQFCRHCHGGDRLGGIHGTNMKRVQGDSVPQGIRFLNGATWTNGLGRPVGGGGTIGCYTQGTASNVSGCVAHDGTGTTYTSKGANATYTYDGY